MLHADAALGVLISRTFELRLPRVLRTSKGLEAHQDRMEPFGIDRLKLHDAVSMQVEGLDNNACPRDALMAVLWVLKTEDNTAIDF